METTSYFEFRRQFPDRAQIEAEWIERTISKPLRQEIQSDGRIRKWSKIEDAGGKFLRVILLPDGKTVHNAFFDRTFKE
jgi:hypothetical protein